MTHDLEMNFNKIAPFGKEDTARELQDHAAKTQDTLVDAVENAEAIGDLPVLLGSGFTDNIEKFKTYTKHVFWVVAHIGNSSNKVRNKFKQALI